MRRLILCLGAVCVIAAPTAGIALAKKSPAKGGKGVLCVLQARLSAASETTGSTSTAKGHTLIKVRRDGTIQI